MLFFSCEQKISEKIQNTRLLSILPSFPLSHPLGLLRVVAGIEVFDPRFNIVSPGVDETVYYPFSESKRRLTSLQPRLKKLMYGGDDDGDDDDDHGRGRISAARRSLPVLFSMARLDSVKNLVGLARMFAGSARLRALCNLFIVGGDVGQGQGGGGGGENEKKNAKEEAYEEDESERLAREMHSLFDSGALPRGEARWVSAQSNATANAEMYRLVADTRGAFVQPALFENFGLTCLEAMQSALPTIATKNGGPSELIKHG